MDNASDLDRLAAEQVLGWTPTGNDYVGPRGRRAIASFKPSSDIADAFELLEFVRPQCQVVIIRWIIADHWLVEFAGYKAQGAGVARAHGPILPLAITEAAIQIASP